MTTIQALINPRAFFKEMDLAEESLKLPALIVLAIGIIGAVSAYLVTGLTIQMLPVEAQAFGIIMLGIGAVSAIVVAFIMWGIIAGVFYVLSLAFKGEGTFNRTLSYVGYGFLPQIIGGVITTALVYSFISTVRIPSVTDPELIEGVLLAMFQDPMMQISGVVGLLFFIWSANIWVFAMASARNLTMRNALITVGVPVALYVIYSLFTLL
jgi:hypothetical protein